VVPGVAGLPNALQLKVVIGLELAGRPLFSKLSIEMLRFAGSPAGANLFY